MFVDTISCLRRSLHISVGHLYTMIHVYYITIPGHICISDYQSCWSVLAVDGSSGR